MPIHIAITRRVRPGCEAEFQQALREFLQTSFAHGGVLGANMLVPLPGSGSREYGILSVFYALWADVDVPLRFPPGAFQPPPRVDSAVLRARFLASPRAQVADPERFERLVQTAFARRRQTLENNLQDSYPNLKEHLRLLKIEGRRRAETLSVVEFAQLANALSQ